MNEKFNIFLPIEKSIKSDESHGRFIRGYASTPNEDAVGDIVLPSEININTFMNRGYINYEHKEGSSFKIGVPTDKTYIDPKRGLYVEAKLFDDNPYADKMWEFAKRISSGEEKQSDDHMLGFSIEGNFSHRDMSDLRVMKNVNITNVALTINPKNKHASWQAFTKSLTTGDDIILPGDTGSQVLRAQNIARDIKNISFAIQDFSGNDWLNVAKALDQEDRFDDTTAAIFLQLQQGVSFTDAKNRINKQ